MDSDSILVIFDLSDLSIEVKTRIMIPLQEIGCHSFNNCVEATRINNEVVVITENVGSQVIACTAVDKGAFQWGEIVFEICCDLIRIEQGI